MSIVKLAERPSRAHVALITAVHDKTTAEGYGRVLIAHLQPFLTGRGPLIDTEVKIAHEEYEDRWHYESPNEELEALHAALALLVGPNFGRARYILEREITRRTQP